MTSPGSRQSERKARKEFVRDRQRMVITIGIGFLAVCLVLATLTLFGVFKSHEEKVTQEAASDYGVTAPCVAEGATTPDYTQVNIRVLNGTSSSGIALAVSKALNYRGFVIAEVADWSNSSMTRTEIRFGKEGIAQAYAVYAQFNDAILRMDDRSDKLVDVVIGSSFEDINDIDEVSMTAGTKLTSISGCEDAAKIKNIPKAPEHTAVN